LNKIENMAAWLILLTGWRRYMVVFICGLVSTLAMPPIDLFVVFFATLPMLVWAIDGAYSDGETGLRAKFTGAFLIGWWFGFGYFLSGLWWVGNAFLVEAEDFIWALPFAIVLLPAGLAVFWGAATVLARMFWSDHWSRILTFALTMGLAEYGRSVLFTGFPWNVIGQAAMTQPFMMQSVSLVGQHAITLLAVLVFAMPLVVMASGQVAVGRRYRLLMIPLVLVVAHGGYGLWRLSANQTQSVEGVHLRLIQPAIDQKTKFTPEHESEILETYFRLSKGNDQSGEKGLKDINFLIWPESAFPFLLTERRDVLSAIGEMLPADTQLITGALRAEPGSAGNPYGHVYNSVYLIDGNGEIAGAADKVHLVPFGEYLPFQSSLETMGLEQLTRLKGGFETGSERKVLQGRAAGPFVPLICYEIIFPGEVLADMLPTSLQTESAQWIVNITNDGWFGYTPGPYQHFRQAVIRGIEEGLPVVRVANTGISSVNDSYGRIIHRLGLGEEGYIDSELPVAAAPTLYSRYRDMPFFVMLAFLAFACLGFRVGARGRFL
jgi:apolipoprotein N-acyltransferase